MTETTISVIIISRNEEKNIARSIESVIEATKDVNSEIILADSGSKDKTIEIAKKYPIRIYQLKNEKHFSPAAGRYLGFINSRGKFIQFIDGDSVLDRDWFKNSIPIMEKDDSVAVIEGLVTIKSVLTYSDKREYNRLRGLKLGDADYIEVGTNLCRRKVLEEVGPYNPYIKFHEEAELSLRIKEKGYRIIRVPYQMAYDLGENKSFSRFILNKFKYTIGYGQILRYILGNSNLFSKFLEDHRLLLLHFSIYSVLLVVILVDLIFDNYFSIFVPILLLLAFTSAYAECKSIKKALTYAVLSPFRSLFFARGLLINKKNLSNFEIEAKVVRIK
ncbi:MAG: glycosyltransferase [Petrotogales bacterium]